MEAFFQATGLVFWIIVGVIFVAIVLTVEDDDESKLGWPLGLLIIGTAVLYFINKSAIKSLGYNISDNLVNFIMFTVLYLGLGLVWSLFKWFRFLRKKRKEYDEAVIEWEGRVKENKHTISKVPYITDYRPYAKDNKEQISSWIVFWPFSGIRYIVGNLLTDFVSWFVSLWSKLFDNMGDRTFKIKSK